MPTLTDNRVPSYRLHKQSGQAVVTLSGRDCLLGPHGTAASKAEYRRRLAEWIAAGRQAPKAAADFSVTELIARYKTHCEGYYRHADGTATGEATNIRQALRPLRKVYGGIQASAFSPLCLKAVRETMICPDAGDGWTRKSTNKQVNRIRQMFKWAVENELVPPSVYHGLLAVSGLKAGRTEARESEPVRPVPDAYVDAVLPLVSAPVAAIIRLQLFTGARPGELCILRTADIDTAGKVWVYRPPTHKTTHHGHAREIRIGPKAQDVLRPFLKNDLQAFAFSPADADRQRREALHAARKTPLSCGNTPGSNRKRKPKRTPGDRYDVASLRRAICRACDQAFPPPDELKAEGKDKELTAWRREHRWHPHQLRHNAATNLRREFGIDLARIILGHRDLKVTELYAEADVLKADDAMLRIG